MGSNRMSRRSFGTSLAVGVPAAMLGKTRVAAQSTSATPPATPAIPASGELGFGAQVTALEPGELLSRLLSEPVDPGFVMIPGEFTPQEAPAEEMAEDEFSASALGGVLIVRSDGEGSSNEQILGAYAVYASEADATRATEALPGITEGERADDASVFPLTIAGLNGVTVVSNNYASSFLHVGSAIVIGSDLFLADGARTSAEAAVIRSTYYLMGMLDHLHRITRDAGSG